MGETIETIASTDEAPAVQVVRSAEIVAALQNRKSDCALTSIVAWTRLERAGLAKAKPTATGVAFSLTDAGESAA